MSPDEQYCFDLNGYLLLKNVIPADVLDRANQLADDFERRANLTLGPRPADGREPVYEKRFEPMILEDEVFLDIATNPEVIDRVISLVKYPRLRSCWLDFKCLHGCVGHHSNHTPYNPMDYYHFQNGEIHCSALAVCCALRDIAPDGGALEVIPGSHKSNFPLPRDQAVLASLRRTLPMSAGDVLLFSHDMNHGSLNRTRTIRRTVFTTFCEGFSSNRLGGNEVYEELFNRLPEGSWRKYLVRTPSPFVDTYPRPTHAPLDEEPALQSVQ